MHWSIALIFVCMYFLYCHTLTIFFIPEPYTLSFLFKHCHCDLHRSKRQMGASQGQDRSALPCPSFQQLFLRPSVQSTHLCQHIVAHWVRKQWLSLLILRKKDHAQLHAVTCTSLITIKVSIIFTKFQVSFMNVRYTSTCIIC